MPPLALCISSLTAALLAAQSAAAGAAKPHEKPAPTVLTISGCVAAPKAIGNPLTLSGGDGRAAYRLTGMSLKRYVGQRVEVIGGPDTSRFRIVGGLTPSPNAAAQAGALDPARAAIAADPMSTASHGEKGLPEFRVRSVRPLDVGCE